MQCMLQPCAVCSTRPTATTVPCCHQSFPPQVSTLRALEHKDDGSGEKQLQGRLRLLPGPIQDVIEFTRQHSWRALFAGLRPAVVATATSQGVYHTVYSMLRQMAVVGNNSCPPGASASDAQ